MDPALFIQSVIFKKKSKYIFLVGLILLLLLLGVGAASAARVHGTVYEWDSFKPLENVLVEVNSTPGQYYVATDASYAFNLSSGSYLITARYFEGDSLKYMSRESVIISDEGDYVLDLLLFPDYEEDLLEESRLEEFGQVFESDAISAKKLDPPETKTYSLLPFLLFFLGLLFAGGYFLKRKLGGEKGNENEKSSLKETVIPVEEVEELGEAEEVEEGGEVEGKKAENLKKAHSVKHKEVEDVIPERIKISLKGLPEASAPRDSEPWLPKDLQELVQLIRANGNRITQKELRKKSPYSESKVSLMLSDLEERGLIEKFKKGRGNIIRIPDEQLRASSDKSENQAKIGDLKTQKGENK